MQGALVWLFSSSVVQMSTRALILSSLAGLGCGAGRIPGLGDSGGQRADSNQAIADAARDVPVKADVLVGSGGSAGGARTGGATGQGGVPGPGGRGQGGVPGTGGRGLGGGSGESGSTAGCSGEVEGSRASRDPAEVLLMLDRSESMSNSIAADCTCDSSITSFPVCSSTSNCTSRWASLVGALGTAMSSTPFLHWGLKFFPSPNADTCRVTSGVEVPIGADSAAEIQSQIAASRPALGTPTAAALTEGVTYLESLTDTKSKVILLATDGEPNCAAPSTYPGDADIAGTSKAITAAREAGFLVYVIGIGPSVPNLDTFAESGGTGRYYPSESPEELTKALVSVSKAALCTFALATMPPDPTNIAVYLDDALVPQDASSGWSFGRDSLTILLHGSACDQALAEPDSVVEVVFGCGPPLPPKTLP